MPEKNLQSLGNLVSLAKRRGLVFQSSEVYGGVSSCWDYGPLGVELKNNLKRSWWRSMTLREDVVGLDSSILMHPKVWQASGHVEGFHDPMVDCKKCKSRYRVGEFDPQAPCPHCGARGEFTSPKNFNLMFRTQMGPVEGSSSQIYLRPETAQGIFVNFLNVQSTMRKKIPFGVAQIGKAFRNEITPGHFIFRTREFEQMELQYFVAPGAQGPAMEQWRQRRWRWYLSCGLRRENLRWHSHPQEDLAHYADAAFDIEFQFPMGWGEVEGIHSRTDFDLSQHEKSSKKNLHYTDQESGQKWIPYVVETSAGCDRCFLAILCDAYREEDERVVMKLAPHLAPVEVAVLPLVKRDSLIGPARKLFEGLQGKYRAEFDVVGSIGKRYRRQDEIGTPLCLTFDFDGLKDHCVTIRNRDSMKQQRVSLDRVEDFLREHNGQVGLSF